MGERAGPTLIQSVQRALRLLEVVAERDGRAHAKELARAAGLALSTTYHLLRTLTHEDYLQRLEDGSYVLGHRLDVVRDRGPAARGVAHARSALEWLRDELGGAVYLATHVDGEIVIVEIVDSPKAPRIDLWVGIHDAAHATALGKSILGQLSPADREDYLARHPLYDLTPHTFVDRNRLCAVLPDRDTLAVDAEEYAVGVCCLAAPVCRADGVGALGFITTRAALREQDTMPETLRTAAARVSRALALGD
ncbi:MAG: helix-turn-helix domain-containing protein [Pseudonocardia sp.]|nr:helix-turn-helix domain-containing protein [Pseudonocardia sp.]